MIASLSLIIFSIESESVSRVEFQVSPKIFVVGAACILSSCALRFRASELEVHWRRFIPAS